MESVNENSRSETEQNSTNKVYSMLALIGLNLAATMTLAGNADKALGSANPNLRSWFFVSAFIVTLILAFAIPNLAEIYSGKDIRTSSLKYNGISLVILGAIIVSLYLLSAQKPDLLPPLFWPNIGTPAAAFDDGRLVTVEARVDAHDKEIGQLKQVIRNIEERLMAAGIPATVIEDVSTSIETNQYVTHDEILSFGLNQNQTQQVIAILTSFGFLTEQEINQLNTREAEHATVEAIRAEEMTREATCLVTPLKKYPTVYIRTSSRRDLDNDIEFIRTGESRRAIGQNGRSVDDDLWWLVESDVMGENNEKKKGWIAANAVEENNPGVCFNLPEFPSE